MWTEPKTDWKSSDKINYEDYNRTKNNIDYLISLGLELYATFPYQDMGDDKNNYASLPYADEFNNLEYNLESMKDYTFAFFNTSRGQWAENQPTPTYIDMNRLESACLALYNGYVSQKEAKHRLSFRLGTRQSDIRL